MPYRTRPFVAHEHAALLLALCYSNRCFIVPRLAAKTTIMMDNEENARKNIYSSKALL